jgi:adenylate cyclase
MEREEKKRPRRWRWAAVGGVAVLIIIAGGLAIWNFYFRPTVEPASVEKMAFSLPDEPSIAVLPFTNMSGDREEDYFSDGFTEQIINGLSKLPRLFVIARNSTFTYKGKAVKVQQVAEELGVRYVLEGSVQKAGEKIRITAQLIDALTGRHLWAERYDRDLKDIFALQDEITIEILSAIQVKLTSGEQARIKKRETHNLEAYIKVMQGYEYFFRFNKEGNLQARKLAEEAIALDPQYATAYCLLGQTHYMDPGFGLSNSPRKSLQESAKLLQRTLAIDEAHPVASSVLSYVYSRQGQQEKSLAQAERAVALNPNMAPPNVMLGGALFRVGRYEEAIQFHEKAIRLDPKGPVPFFTFLGIAYCFAGRYEDAIATYKKAISLAPDSPITHTGLAATYILAGREKEAHAEAAEVLRIDPMFSLERYAKTVPFRKAEKEPWIAALRKAGIPEKPPLPLPDKPSIAVLPFVNMSGDPEQEYFSDGVTESIITALSKAPRLFVISRSSTFTYKGKPVNVKNIGRELGVRHVLEGSVQKSGRDS